MIENLHYTRSGVRMQRHAGRTGGLNWLLLPGGPGIGSESLIELADTIEVPGTVWRVDLPGDGSNRNPPGADGETFHAWPSVLVEAAQAVPDAVFVGHSTGGMYLLATPELEGHVRGLALLDTAPDAGWFAHYVRMTQAHPLPEFDAALKAFEEVPDDTSLGQVAVASAPWNFTPAGLAAGRALLERMPYNRAAVEWSDRNFDHSYEAAWWPQTLPVLRLAGAEDRIVWQGGWAQARFQTPNVTDVSIAGAGHFPWIENPNAVRAAFQRFAARLHDT